MVNSSVRLGYGLMSQNEAARIRRTGLVDMLYYIQGGMEPESKLAGLFRSTETHGNE